MTFKEAIIEMYNTGEIERCCGEHAEEYLNKIGMGKKAIEQQMKTAQRIKNHLEAFAGKDGMISNLPTPQIMLLMECTNIIILQDAITFMGRAN